MPASFALSSVVCTAPPESQGCLNRVSQFTSGSQGRGLLLKKTGQDGHQGGGRLPNIHYPAGIGK